jgi:hypothetical protein
MNADIHLEHRAGSSQGKHEGEPSLGLCDRLNLTRDNSQRQLPTDHDYAVSTREYQTDQSSLKTAPTAARSVFGKRQKQRQRQKQPHRFGGVDTVTPYQANALIELGQKPGLVFTNALFGTDRLSSPVLSIRPSRSGRGSEGLLMSSTRQIHRP